MNPAEILPTISSVSVAEVHALPKLTYALLIDEVVPWPCPYQEGFNTSYTFIIPDGNKTFIFTIGTFTPGNSDNVGVYRFPDPLTSTDGKAVLRAPSIFVHCVMKWEVHPDGGMIRVIYIIRDAVFGIPELLYREIDFPPPDDTPVPGEATDPATPAGPGGGTGNPGFSSGTLWCAFLTYYDADGNIISRTTLNCWWVAG